MEGARFSENAKWFSLCLTIIKSFIEEISLFEACFSSPAIMAEAHHARSENRTE
jgi:hypothetical protein